MYYVKIRKEGLEKMQGINVEFLSSWMAASIRSGAPLMLTGVGGVYTERVGVFNIGMEGMMLAGAFAAIVGSYFLKSILIATLAAMAVGGLLGLIHAYITVTCRANQIVSGLAINFLSLGVTNLLNARLFHAARMRAKLYPIIFSTKLQNLPFFGSVLFSQSLIVWIAFILPLIGAWFLYRTNWGLNIRAVGENPYAVASAGLSVTRIKYIGVIISGICSGLGGSALVLSKLGYFTPGITAGRGFIVLAALVLGKWNPIWVALVGLLFGGADALQLRLQTFESAIPYQFPVMLPYILTIAALAGFIGRTVPPKTVGKPYYPEKF